MSFWPSIPNCEACELGAVQARIAEQSCQAGNADVPAEVNLKVRSAPLEARHSPFRSAPSRASYDDDDADSVEIGRVTGEICG